jgi:hypothetical protein
MYKVVRSSRLYEQIVQQIEASILKGTLKAGDQLLSLVVTPAVNFYLQPWAAQSANSLGFDPPGPEK